MSATDEDQTWMRAYRRDDAEAFARIYGAYSDAVYGYLVKRIRDEAERDDLFQRIWMKFHRARDQWSPEYPLLQWLFVIARSEILDGRRARARSPFGWLSEDSEKALSRVVSAESNAIEDAREAETIAERMRAEGLSAEQVEVVRRRVFEEEDYAEIAARLGKSPVSVRKVFSRAIEKLRMSRASEDKR